METFVQFAISTKVLKDTLTGLLKLWATKAKEKVINIKAYDKYIEIGIPGATKKVRAEVEGEANIILPVKLLLAYLQTCSSEVITLKFSVLTP